MLDYAFVMHAVYYIPKLTHFWILGVKIMQFFLNILNFRAKTPPAYFFRLTLFLTIMVMCSTLQNETFSLILKQYASEM